LRNLQFLVYCSPNGSVRDKCRDCLAKYTNRLILECRPEEELDAGTYTELNTFLNQMHQHGFDEDNLVVPNALRDEAYAAIAKLRSYRLERITALQTTYPSLHYGLLGVLALAQCIMFLVETNLDVLLYLNAFQLKVLWSVLVGTFTACFAVFSDLQTPFTGYTYKITSAVDQLFEIREGLKHPSWLEAEESLLTKKRESAAARDNL
jgi:hypothetical protein